MLATPRPLARTTFEPVDFCHVAYIATTLLMILVFFAAIPRAGMWAGVSLALLVVALGLPIYLRRFGDGHRALARLVQTVVTIPVVFTQLGSLIPYVRQRSFERELYNFDVALFGGREPLALINQTASPWFTEALQWIYNYYFFIPVVLGVAVVRAGRPRNLHHMLFVTTLCIYLSYVGYYLVPATGPNIDKLGLYGFTDEVHGVFMTREFRSSIAAVEQIKQDCFPSGHTAVSVVALLLAYRFARSTVPVLWLAVVALIWSTMYLRYHYVADVLSGILLAFLADFGGAMIYKAFERRTGGTT